MKDTPEPVPPMTGPVADVVAGFSPAAQARFAIVRAWIFEEAAALGVGPLTETLKWGEPSYLTEATRAGTTVRLAWKAKALEDLQLLVHCQTRLVDTFRERFGDTLSFSGNRAVHVPLEGPVAEGPIRQCIALALTYHRRG